MPDILAICAALAVLAGGATVAAKAWQVLRKISSAVDDWQGEPARPGVLERPGVMTRLAAIEAQLHPNGGASLRDAVDDLAKQMDQHLKDHAQAGG